MIPPSLPPFGRWWISFSRPFPSIRLLLPIHRRDHSIYLLLRTWLKRFSRRINDGKACHTLLHTLNKFERVSDSPTQGKELQANPDILDLLRNKVPDSRYVPLSFKDSAALERSMRSMLETHSFLTWSVMAFIRSLHDRNLLPKDDQIISQLQKSFSKACGNLASGLSSSAAFVALKRRQLLLSHVVPSVSDAQKRNLLSDPFWLCGS